MSLIEWNDAQYSVKIDQFDNDHKKLVQFINELHKAMLSGKGRDIVGKILEDLQAYTLNHFSAEEREMEAVGYPDLAEHRKLHQELIQKVGILISDYKMGKKEISIDTFRFLKEWLFNHIQVADKKYSPWLAKKD